MDYQQLFSILYIKDFGRIVQESIKRSTSWSANYYTHPSSYHPVTKNEIKLEKMPVLQKPPKKPISKRDLAELRMWAKRHGKAVPQRSVRRTTVNLSQAPSSGHVCD